MDKITGDLCCWPAFSSDVLDPESTVDEILKAATILGVTVEEVAHFVFDCEGGDPQPEPMDADVIVMAWEGPL